MPPNSFEHMLTSLLSLALIVGTIGLILSGVLFYLKLRIVEFIRSKMESFSARKASGTAVFHAKTSPLTEPEQELYRRLAKAMPEHIVLAQVAFSQLLYAADGSDSKENFRTQATMKQKVADFVICGPRFNIVSIVELDDSSHDPQKDKDRDAKVAQAGLKTVRWHVSKLPDRTEIRWRILGLKSESDGQEISRWAPR